MLMFERLADSVRTSAYLTRLKTAVKSGMAVLEIGPQAGALALAALKMGASRATVIQQPGFEQLVQDLASSNEVAERVEVLSGRVSLIDMEADFDLLLGDPRGDLPDFGEQIDDMLIARQRFLKPGGSVLPAQDKVWLAPLQRDDWHPDFLESEISLDLSQLTRFAFNQISPLRASAVGLAKPQLAATVDYCNDIESGLNFSGTWHSQDPSLAHGLLTWFESDMGYSSRLTSSYSPLFLPFQVPLSWGPDCPLEITLRATPTKHGCAWSWSGAVGTKSARQCSLFGAPDSLRRIEPSNLEQFA